MVTIYLCRCCGQSRPVGSEPTPCPWCEYDGTWSRAHRRHFIRTYRRKNNH